MINKLHHKRKITKDFNVETYKKYLILAKRYNYKFISFSNFNKKNFKKKKLIILRHDVDIDLKLAEIFAKIEFDLNIKSTFFVMTNNNLYNLFSKNSKKIIYKILSYGHSIGLHHDVSYYKNYNLNVIKKNINREIKFINEIFSYKIKYVSFHKPEKFILKKKIINKNFISVYNKEFISSKLVRYISDSGAFWKEKPLNEILKENNKTAIHLLIHPELYFFSKKKILNERINKIVNYKGFLLHSLAEEEINSLENKIRIYKNDKKNRISIQPY